MHGDANTKDRKRRGGSGRKLLIQLALVPVALGALELGVRGWRAAGGRPYSAGWARAELEAALDAIEAPLPRAAAEREEGPRSNIKDAYVLHPYYGFTATSELEEVARLTELFAAGLEPDTYVVMVLGGSVAGMTGDALRDFLEADPRWAHRPTMVVNLGRGANRQPQQLVRTLFMLGLGIVPHVIVNIDGFNEAAFGRNNHQLGVHPSYPYWPRWAHLALGRQASDEELRLAARVMEGQDRAAEYAREALEGPWLASAISGPRVLARMSGLSSAWVEDLTRYQELLAGGGGDEPRGERATARGPVFEGGVEAATDSVVRTWFECSVALASYCETRGIDYLHVLQPTLYDAGSKPLTEVELQRGRHARSYRKGVLDTYPRMRAAADDLAAQGVRYLDASMLFEDVEEEIYIDYCHFNAFGSGLLVELVADAVHALERDPTASRAPEPRPGLVDGPGDADGAAGSGGEPRGGAHGEARGAGADAGGGRVREAGGR